MQETVCLIPDSLNYIRVPVAGITNADATNGVKIFFSGSIVKIKSLRTDDLQSKGVG